MASNIFPFAPKSFLESLAQLIHKSLKVVDGFLLFVDHLVEFFNKKILVRDFDLEVDEAFFCGFVRSHSRLCREFISICHAFFHGQDFLLPSL